MKIRGRNTLSAAVGLGALLLTLIPAARTYSQNVAAASCQDVTRDCKKPKYLGPKGSCACFACKKNKADEDLRVVCTSKLEEKIALFEAEDRDDPALNFYRSALARFASVEEFKASVKNFDLDPYGITLQNLTAPSMSVQNAWIDPSGASFRVNPGLSADYGPGYQYDRRLAQRYTFGQNNFVSPSVGRLYNFSVDSYRRDPAAPMFDWGQVYRNDLILSQRPESYRFNLPGYRSPPNTAGKIQF